MTFLFGMLWGGFVVAVLVDVFRPRPARLPFRGKL